MDRAFLPFAHRLQSVPQAVEQATHRGRAHTPSLLGQRRRQFRAALARPPQRGCRVAARQRIHERFEGRQNPRLVLLNSRTSRARRFTACDLAATLADRLPRQTGGRRHQRVAAIANRRRLGRCPQPATTLVQHRRDRAVLSTARDRDVASRQLGKVAVRGPLRDLETAGDLLHGLPRSRPPAGEELHDLEQPGRSVHDGVIGSTATGAQARTTPPDFAVRSCQ